MHSLGRTWVTGDHELASCLRLEAWVIGRKPFPPPCPHPHPNPGPWPQYRVEWERGLEKTPLEIARLSPLTRAE